MTCARQKFNDNSTAHPDFLDFLRRTLTASSLASSPHSMRHLDARRLKARSSAIVNSSTTLARALHGARSAWHISAWMISSVIERGVSSLLCITQGSIRSGPPASCEVYDAEAVVLQTGIQAVSQIWAFSDNQAFVASASASSHTLLRAWQAHAEQQDDELHLRESEDGMADVLVHSRRPHAYLAWPRGVRGCYLAAKTGRGDFAAYHRRRHRKDRNRQRLRLNAVIQRFLPQQFPTGFSEVKVWLWRRSRSAAAQQFNGPYVHTVNRSHAVYLMMTGFHCSKTLINPSSSSLRLHAFSDSQAIVKCILAAPTCSSQWSLLKLQEKARSCLEADGRSTFHLDGVPGHAEVAGKELVDSLAKKFYYEPSGCRNARTPKPSVK
ncbi:hypothetical protein K437DRAFT_265344 [Tilletiaria anomala UBC 951]|uniref:RNase H type-1 domain-containing protein n=1 Tax=Tilletiaria anomala (strain ATCC 24038 / CBS 436.72 / UBC 951) TaxID=1037660 RepID=A0A066VBV9_TILAU|nr:uncharacterized protein K437DRAFT_265344 [Tilletiaria anomala UBC 951]KDN36244.1 hypothetical protein K437DRAFT_265344 [Tilletiaria anomala UBC 951]